MENSTEKQSTGVGRARAFAQFRRLVGFLVPYRGRVFLAILALGAAAAAMLAFGAGLRWLVDRGFADSARLDAALLAMLAVVLALAGASWGRAYLVSWLGERVSADVRRAVYANLLGQDAQFFETARTGELVSRLTADTDLVQTVIGTSASMAMRNAILLVGGTVMMAITSARLTLLVFAVLPLVVAPIVVYGRRVRGHSRAAQDRLAAVGAHVEERVAAIQVVQSFAREGHERREFGARAEAAFQAARRRVATRARMAAMVIFLVFGAVGVVLWTGGHDMLAGRMSAGELSAFVFYAVVVASAAGAMGEFMADVQRAGGAAERLAELLEMRPRIVSPPVPLALPVPARGALTFDNVTFRYPARGERAALQAFSFEVRPGETVALVGPSGAGKSTVFRLALRFHDPQAGAVRFDGVDVARADLAALRRRIAVVPQEAVLFSDDVRANIAFGRPEAGEAEVRRAAEAAGALSFIEALPQGFATALGERGVRLSGGQRQRIAIARALLADPALLLLDEATSALDAESERAVQAALERLMRGRTTLVIAHRLATVRRADRIVVMDEGRVVASGTHAELAAGGGLYARLAALQFVPEAG